MINVKRIGYHLLFWVVLLLYQLSTSISNKSLVGDYWWGDWKILHVLLVEVFFKALFAYGFVYFIIPKFLDTRKYVFFVLSTLVWLYVVAALYIATYYFYMEQIYEIFLWGNKESISTMPKRLTHFGLLLTIFSNLFLPAIILGAIKFYKNQLLLSKVKEEKNKMELRVLKNQLNPHFLFNTLNNLYSFVVNESPKAPDMILRLSGILDYALYKSSKPFVPLQEEVTAIENFIELEKNRYGERLKVSFENKVLPTSTISPLLLLSLVENAFKHGASGDVDEPEIKVKITSSQDEIRCRVWNTKSQYTGEQNDEYKKGIGLFNVARQLDLIYPNIHELKIEEDQTTFSILLHIKPTK